MKLNLGRPVELRRDGLRGGLWNKLRVCTWDNLWENLWASLRGSLWANLEDSLEERR